MSKVIVNRVRCKKCNDIISSSYRHDFRNCACNSIFTDGGTDYQRCGWGGRDSKGERLERRDCIDFSLSIYQDPVDEQDSLDEVLDLVKEIADEVMARKRDGDSYEALHYERELKGHLTEILKLKRELENDQD